MRIPLALAITLVVALAGCSGSKPSSSSSPSSSGTPTMPMEHHEAMTFNVSMQGNAFSPANITIHMGDQLVWTDNDGPPTGHTVTSGTGDAEQFESSSQCLAPAGLPQHPVPNGCMVQGDTFKHTFETAGSYHVHCRIHSTMTMSITVVEHNMTIPMGPSQAI